MDRQRANCGGEQTMKRMLVCHILSQPCTHVDLEEFNPRARSCARALGGSRVVTREEGDEVLCGSK